MLLAARRKIIAFDVATTTGVCEGVPGERPRFSHIKFASADHPQTFAAARAYLSGKLAGGGYDVAYVESPLAFAAKQGKTNAEARKRLIGLWAVFSAALVGSGIEYHELTVADIRRGFIGLDQCDRDEAKARARLMCLELGWSPETLDEADAGALWWCACAREARSVTPLVTPLMHHKIAGRARNERIVAAASRRPRKPRKVMARGFL